jgi:hypothetical protein
VSLAKFTGFPTRVTFICEKSCEEERLQLHRAHPEDFTVLKYGLKLKEGRSHSDAMICFSLLKDTILKRCRVKLRQALTQMLQLLPQEASIFF